MPQVDIGENEPRNEVWDKITHKNINPIYKPPILHLVPTRDGGAMRDVLGGGSSIGSSLGGLWFFKRL